MNTSTKEHPFHCCLCISWANLNLKMGTFEFLDSSKQNEIKLDRVIAGFGSFKGVK